MVQGPLVAATTQQLEYLDAVDRHPTWAEAASELGVTPSALSQGLSELERRLGVALFERSGRSRAMTGDGRVAVTHARSVLAAVTDLSSWAAAARTGAGGVVRLGLIDVAAVHHYPTVVRRFRAERPEVELHLTVGASADLLAQVVAGALDAAVIVEPPTLPPGLAAELALTESLAIYGPPHGQYQQDPATWGPWVTFPPQSHTRHHVGQALRALGSDFKVEAESHQPEVLRQLVQLDLGWTVLPVFQAEVGANPLVRARPEPLLERRLITVLRAGASPSAACSALLDQMSTIGG